MEKYLAGNIPVGNFTAPGSLGVDPTVNAPGRFSDVISTVIGVMTIIAFIWFTIQLFLAAVQVIGAGSDKATLEKAKSKLSNSLIGLVMVISAIFFIEVVGIVLGISILDLPALINAL